MENCEAIVVDLVVGDNFFTLRQNYKKDITEEEGRTVIYKLTKAMASYHSKGYVHRDMHSMNLVIQYHKL